MTPGSPSDADTARLWLEYLRRQLGQPAMTDDEYERLGHRVYGHEPDDDPKF